MCERLLAHISTALHTSTPTCDMHMHMYMCMHMHMCMDMCMHMCLCMHMFILR